MDNCSITHSSDNLMWIYQSSNQPVIKTNDFFLDYAQCIKVLTVKVDKIDGHQSNQTQDESKYLKKSEIKHSWQAFLANMPHRLNCIAL